MSVGKKLRSMSRTALGCIFAAVMLASFVFPAVQVFAETQDPAGRIEAPRKIISVVFDDSASMYWEETGKNKGREKDYWASANYATQVFAALMNPQDRLYITYMSDIYQDNMQSVEIDLQDAGKAVKTIREKKSVWKGTPLRAVRQALDKLKEVRDTDRSTQYWLVVLTDGELEQEANGKTFDEYADLKDGFEKIRTETMSNGLPPQIYYYHMGKDEKGKQPIKDDPSNGIMAVYSDNIVGALNDISNTVSGRLRYDSGDITFVDDRTVRVSSRLPLYSLSVFTQNSSAEVASASVEAGSAGGSEMTLDHTNVEVSSPDPNQIIDPASTYYAGGHAPKKPTDLVGNVSSISGGGQVIPSGDYLIRFSEPVSAGDMTIMYQPAVDLRLSVSQNGKIVDDLSAILEGDDIEVQMIPVDPSTGKEMDKGLLPAGTEWEITVGKDGSDLVSEKDLAAKVQDIQTGKYEISGRMIIPGMTGMEAEPLQFTIGKYAPVPKIHLKIIRKNGVNEDVYYDNREGTDRLDELRVGDRVSVLAEALDETSGDPVDAARLKTQEDWTIEHQLEGQSQGTRPSNEYRDISLSAGENRILCGYRAGALEAEESVSFTVRYPAVYSLETERDTGTFFRSGLTGKGDLSEAPVLWITMDEDRDLDGTPDGKPARLSQTEIPQNEAVLADDVVFEKDHFGFLPNGIGFIGADIKCVQNSDGSYAVYPELGGIRGGLVRHLFPYLIRTGHYHVTGVLNSNAAEQEVTIDVRGRITDWIPLLIELFLLWLVYRILFMLFLKQKFAKGYMLNVDAWVRNPDGRGVEAPGQNEQISLKPRGEHPFSKKPAQMRVRALGITVHANAVGMPYIETYKAYGGGDWGVTAAPPRKFDSVKRTIAGQSESRRKKESGEADQHIFSADPTYFYDGVSTLYAVTVKER